MKLNVRVPATTANLGPGFDCLGLALQLWNTILVEDLPESATAELEVRVRGESTVSGETVVSPRDANNLVVRAMRELFDAARTDFPPLRVTMTNRIPIGRGLGSSAAAIVGGLVAANAWLDKRFGDEELLALATELEGHPDNVSAALHGGLAISVASANSGKLFTVRISPPRGWRAVLFIPEQALSTQFARGVLPRRVPREDAVFNVGRAALLVHAFARGDARALELATDDRLHQPYRASLVRGMEELFRTARKAGARGVALSGAGPSILALADAHTRNIAHALAQRARELEIPGSTRVVGLSERGAHLK